MVEANQMEYGGLTIGDGTIYPLVSVEGLDAPDIRAEIFQKANASGAWVYALDNAERHIVIEGQVISDDSTDVATGIENLLAAFVPVASPASLVFNLAGLAGSISCVPTRGPTYRLTHVAGKGVVPQWIVELTAEDPELDLESGS